MIAVFVNCFAVLVGSVFGLLFAKKFLLKKSEENSILGISMSSVFAPEEKGNLLQRRLLLQQKKRKIPTPEQTW